MIFHYHISGLNIKRIILFIFSNLYKIKRLYLHLLILLPFIYFYLFVIYFAYKKINIYFIYSFFAGFYLYFHDLVLCQINWICWSFSAGISNREIITVFLLFVANFQKNCYNFPTILFHFFFNFELTYHPFHILKKTKKLSKKTRLFIGKQFS
jgi:hypothetical protein